MTIVVDAGHNGDDDDGDSGCDGGYDDGGYDHGSCEDNGHNGDDDDNDDVMMTMVAVACEQALKLN